MATTNFAALTDEQLTVWSRDFWQEVRNRSFLMAFLGNGQNAMIQRIKELRTTKDGARAVITLVNDATGDGVVGDNTLEGNEEALRSTDCVIQLDQWRHAHESQGRMAEQKSVVQFREEARDKLAARAAEIIDQLGFLTASGVSYDYKPDGTARIGSQLNLLSFNNDVAAPSANRHLRWDASAGKFEAGDTAQVATDDVPSWEMLVSLKAEAVDRFIKPIRTEDGIEMYNVFMTPRGIARLKKDTDFLAAWQHAQKRGDDNPIFKGTSHGGKKGIYIDGLNILEYRNVYHPSTWGGGSVRGQRVLLCGAQALAFADINIPEWVEDYRDFKNRLAISIAKIFGLLKPRLHSTHTGTVEDFSILAADTAI